MILYDIISTNPWQGTILLTLKKLLGWPLLQRKEAMNRKRKY